MELKINIRCPKCRETFKSPLEKVIPGDTAECSHCGATVRFNEKNVQAIRAAIERAIDPPA